MKMTSRIAFVDVGFLSFKNIITLSFFLFKNTNEHINTLKKIIHKSLKRSRKIGCLTLTSGTRHLSGRAGGSGRQRLGCEFFLTEDGDVIQSAFHCAGMSQHQAEEAVMAAHAVRHDRVRGRYRVLFSHHGR